MKLRVVIKYDPAAKSYAAYGPELPGCASAGDTQKEALKNIREAISLYLEPVALKLHPGARVVEVDVR